MTEFLVIYEHGPESWGAYCPDLPGCVAVGESRDEVERLMGEAVVRHVEALRQAGSPVPEPTNIAGTVAA